MIDKELKELIDKNPWSKIAKEMDCIYSEQDRFVVEEDREFINAFNDKKEDQKKYNEKLIVNIPPEPWQGNPLNAKLIFLSLNPGFVKRINWTAAKLIQGYKDTLEKLLDFKKKTLRIEADSFLPEDNDGDPIGCCDAMSILGDEYWEKKFSNLFDDVVKKGKFCSETQFYRDVAIIQYHAYTSTEDGGFPYRSQCNDKWPLTSQEFTRDLIKYIVEHKDTIFVVMRAKDRWKELLDSDGSGWFDTMSNKERILVRNNKSMSQAISGKNLGCIDDDNEKSIYEIIKKVFNKQEQQCKISQQ